MGPHGRVRERRALRAVCALQPLRGDRLAPSPVLLFLQGWVVLAPECPKHRWEAGDLLFFRISPQSFM